MVTFIKTSKVNKQDIAFAKNMIPHHEAALSMASKQIVYGEDPDMVALAKRIYAAQKSEIELLKKFLKDNDEKPSSGMSGMM